jgi:hypothetical protein
VQGGGWVFTSDSNENDGVQLQALSEGFYFGGPYPAYFGACFKVNDADESDAFLGFAIQDTTILAGCTDDIGFRIVDGVAALTFLLEKDSAETIKTVSTVVDDTYQTVEFLYDGEKVTYYLEGVELGSLSINLENFPDDEHLAPAVAYLTGDASANILTVKWARWIQILE